jgi:hypothetical protein
MLAIEFCSKTKFIFARDVGTNPIVVETGQFKVIVTKSLSKNRVPVNVSIKDLILN